MYHRPFATQGMTNVEQKVIQNQLLCCNIIYYIQVAVLLSHIVNYYW